MENRFSPLCTPAPEARFRLKWQPHIRENSFVPLWAVLRTSYNCAVTNRGMVPSRGGSRLKRRSLTVVVLSAALFGWGGATSAGAVPQPLPTPPNLTPPIIQQAPSVIFYGRQFTIVTPDAGRIVQVGLLSVGGGGRSIKLDILGRTRDTLQVLAPRDPHVAPPGQYLLFIYASGPDGLLPSLPALLTLASPPPPSSSPPSPGHSSTPGGTGSGSTGSGRNRGTGSGRGSPGSGLGGSTAPGSGRTQPHAAVASPASARRSVTTGAWLGVVLLVVFLGTFLGLRRMLRA